MIRYVDEFRDAESVHFLLDRIRERAGREMRFMEFCGGHTHAILKFGIRSLLPPQVKMLSGPGCPVCVTSASDMDRALALVGLEGLILATFGDMMRVPGTRGSLQDAKAQGADVRIVYGCLDALALARAHPEREVVFLAVGFETTAPTVAASVLRAREQGVRNFSVLSLHKLTPPAMEAILEAGEVKLDGILGPGHVTTIIGARAWEFLPGRHRIPCAVAGFEAADILRGILALVEMAVAGRPAVCNAYARSVRADGNPEARRRMEEVFQVADADWRGLGRLAASGLCFREEFFPFDAARRYPLEAPSDGAEPAGCRCGDVLRGVLEPPLCPLFGKRCTPEAPVGPCMVSGEGSCAAYFRYAAC